MKKRISVDGLDAEKAKRFAKRFKMKNLRLEGDYWIADDGGEPYTISASNYYGALSCGDLND